MFCEHGSWALKDKQVRKTVNAKAKSSLGGYEALDTEMTAKLMHLECAVIAR